MKKTAILSIYTLILLCGCAKAGTEGTNDAEKRYLDAWIEVNHPDWAAKKVEPGYYILEDIPGTGELISIPTITPYIRTHFRMLDLKGNILSSTHIEDAYKTRSYDPSAFYGPSIMERADNAMYAGIDYAIENMKVGGRRTVLIPGWLMTQERYNTEQEYLDKVSGSTAIYELEITERITDMAKWEQDSLSRYISRNFPDASYDTTGFYRKVLVPPVGGERFQNDTTIYINYIGRRLDGVVFDTNIADTAKFYGIHSSGSSYSPTLINLKKSYMETTMTSSGTSVITGFKYLLSKMGPYEKAIGFFTSDMGYSYSGSGLTIPAYSPLRFDIEVVDKP